MVRCLLAMIVCLLCALPVLAAEGQIVDSGTCGDDLTWELDAEGTLTIRGTGLMEKYDVALSDHTFEHAPWRPYSSEIRKIVVSEGVTSIGRAAFRQCVNLTEVMLPESLILIEKSAFYECSSMPAIEIPGSVEELGVDAFWGCSALNDVYISDWDSWCRIRASRPTAFPTHFADNLYLNGELVTDIVVPDGVTTIDARYNTGENLTSIVIPDSVTEISYFALAECTALKEVDLPAGLTAIENDAFRGCSALEQITIPGGVKVIEDDAFYECSALENVTIGEGVTKIDNYAFLGCSSLEEITIPDSVTAIGTWAFGGCSSLQSVSIGSGIRTIEHYAFSYQCTKLKDVHITDLDNWSRADIDSYYSSPVYYAENVYADGELITDVVIPDGVTVVDFRYGKNLRRITIPEGVVSIDTFAFQKCASLTEVVLPESVESIGRSAFQLCSGLQKVNIPDSVISIGNSAFDQCTSLTEIDIPDSVTTIGTSAFYGCSALKRVRLPEGMQTIGQEMFYNCRSLKEIVIPDTVTEIGPLAFYDCVALERVVIPRGVTTIGTNAFDHCESLKEVVIPDTVTTLDRWSFSGCQQLQNIFFEGDAPEIGEYAFFGVKAQVYYHADTEGWENAARNQYGGQLTWRPICSEHHYEVVVTVPTCTTQGHSQYTCTVCGETYTDDHMDALGHDLGDWIVINQATCINRGSRERSCSRCDHVERENMPAKGHVYTTVVYEPTCTSKGFTFYKCDRCTYQYKENYVSALGHDLGDWEILTEATCTSEGYKRSSCSRCAYYTTRAIPVTDHDYRHETKAPTCTGQGYTIRLCQDCGKRTVFDRVNALGHDLGEWETTKDATCTRSGSRERSCSRCAYIETALIMAAGHGYQAEVTLPTCTEQGYTTHVCICGDSKTDAYMDPLGHDYLKGKCTRCGDLLVPVIRASNDTSTGKPVLSWEKVDGAAKYQIYRATSENGTYKYLGSTTRTAFTDNAAKYGKVYYYYVVVCDAAGAVSAPSNIVQRTCRLAQPRISVGNRASDGKITVSWQHVEGAIGYEVYRMDSEERSYQPLTVVDLPGIIDLGVTPGKTYYYKVVALSKDSIADSAVSNVKSRTCDLPQPVVTASRVASSGKIKLTWKKINGAVKYEVYRATSKTGTYKLIKTTSGTSFTNTSATAGKTYYYKVKAIAQKSAANSANSALKTVTCDLPRPEISVTRSSGKPKVSWKKISGAVSYQVYRATSANGSYSLVKTTTGSYYKDTKAKAGKTYYYKVVAVCSNTAGNSASSTVKSIRAK